MTDFSEKEKQFLLKLVRHSIEYYLRYGEKLLWTKEIPAIFQKNCATFVTLTIGGKLRGCIGCLEAKEPLYQSLISNATLAAFFDPRFSPLAKEELDKIKIEISLINQPRKFEYKNINELLKYLDKEKPGLVIKNDQDRCATFLPQVWKELKTAEEFLSHLCLKAGLSASQWKEGNLDIFIFDVQRFYEK